MVSLKNRSILYIDDHSASRHVMELLLTEIMDASNVTLFSDSKNIISRLEELDDNFDLIFLDINISPNDGFWILEQLRQHEKYSPATIIAVTATIISEKLTAIRQAGFDGLIMKPLNYETFPSFLEKILIGEADWKEL